MMREPKNLVRCLILGGALGCLIAFALPADAGTVFYYQFEDNPGFVKDSGPNGLDLSVSNPAPVQYALPASGAGSAFDDPIPQTGDANEKAAQLNGSTRFYASDDAALSVTNFTIEAYFNQASAATSTSYIGAQWATNNRAWGLLVVGSGDLTGNEGSARDLALIVSEDGVGASFTDPGRTFFPSGIDIVLGHDYYVATSFEATNHVDGIKFYVQDLTAGTPMQTASWGHGLSGTYDSTANYDIGGSSGAAKWDGLLDEVRMSNAVLSQSELLVSVPEPSAWILLLGSGLLLAVGRRRRV